MDQINSEPHQEDPQRTRKGPKHSVSTLSEYFKKIIHQKKLSYQKGSETEFVVSEYRMLNRLTFALIVVNACLAWGTFELWDRADRSLRVAQRSLDITDSTSQADLRPYVDVLRVDPMPIGKSGDTDSLQLAQLSIQNFGKTPARNVIINCLFQYWRRDHPAEVRNILHFRQSQYDEYGIAPGEVYPLRIRPNGLRDNDGKLRFWGHMNPRYARQVYGQIIYTDNRNIVRVTTFAFQYEYISGGYRKIGGFNYFDVDEKQIEKIIEDYPMDSTATLVN